MNKISSLLTSKKHILTLCYIYEPISRRLSSSTFSSFPLLHQHCFMNNLLTSNNQQNLRFQSSVSIGNESFLTKLKTNLSRIISDKTKVNISGCLAYEKCADEVDHIQLIKCFQLPDTFQSWFLTMQLHVWMCITITIFDKNGRNFRNSIVDSMWFDVETRLGHLAEMRSSTKKKLLKELVSQFQASLIAYDEGILGEDTVLAAAVWRTMFSFQPVDPEVLEKAVLYIRKQMCHLDSLDRQAVILKGSVTFLPLTSIFSDIEKTNV